MTAPAPPTHVDRQALRQAMRQALRMRRAWPSLGAVNAPSFARALRQRALLTAPPAPVYRRTAQASWINADR